MERSNHDIPLRRLQAISRKLQAGILVTVNIYSVTLLSVATVTHYSRKYRKIRHAVRRELARTYIEDLITLLRDDAIIDQRHTNDLLRDYHTIYQDLPAVINSYMTAGQVLRSNGPTLDNQSHCTLL